MVGRGELASKVLVVVVEFLLKALRDAATINFQANCFCVKVVDSATTETISLLLRFLRRQLQRVLVFFVLASWCSCRWSPFVHIWFVVLAFVLLLLLWYYLSSFISSLIPFDSDWFTFSQWGLLARIFGLDDALDYTLNPILCKGCVKFS